MTKGSGARPFDVSREVYEQNRSRIWPDKPKARWVPPLLPDDEAADLADLQAAFARIEEESRHYMCNGKGWLEGPNGEECGPCGDCPPDLREKHMPESMRAALRRGQQLMALRPNDLSRCAPDCTICDSGIFGSS